MRSIGFVVALLGLGGAAAAQPTGSDHPDVDVPVVAPAAEVPPAPPPPPPGQAPSPSPSPVVDDDEPALPAGLADEDGDPALPTGLDGQGTATTDTAAPSTGIPLEWRAVLELRAGARLIADPGERRPTIAELRAQLDVTKTWQTWSTIAQLVVDGVGDPLADRYAPELETGEGAVDLRTAAITASPTAWLDVRVGRQILTWGTGDLVFINDLFPKDWTAFLIGRRDDYLKAPSDALKLAAFTSIAGLEVILTPRFDADRLPLRDRLSSWDPMLGGIVGRDQPITVMRPERWLRDGEVAARLQRRIGSWELAGYGYRGFWKSPAGFDPRSSAATFPALSVYGASVRGPALGGLFHGEVGVLDSRHDRDGRDPLIRNSEVRALLGHERELVRNVTVGLQYYVEAMAHHARHVASAPAGAPIADRVRHVVTARLTLFARQQRLAVSAFVFGSPSDLDGYLRMTTSYAIDDRWSVSVGANLIAGRDDHTSFAQFANNSNVYAGVRLAY